jgi:uncharacterized protein
MAVFLLACACLAPSAFGADVPQHTGYVTDAARILGDWAPRIAQSIADLERRTSFEVAVLTVDTLAGEEPQAYAQRVYDQWKIGKKGKDNGLLFLVAARDRKLWITTGYGAEKILPDGRVGEIRDRVLRPAFKDGRYGEGLFNGVGAVREIVLQAAGRGEDVAKATGGRRITPRGWSWITIGFLLVIVVVAGIAGTINRRRSGMYGARRGGFDNDAFGPTVGPVYFPPSDHSSSSSDSSDSSDFGGGDSGGGGAGGDF